MLCQISGEKADNAAFCPLPLGLVEFDQHVLLYPYVVFALAIMASESLIQSKLGELFDSELPVHYRCISC